MPQAAIAARAAKPMTPAKLYFCDALLEGLAQDLEDVAAELRPFIQKEDAVVGERHFARHRHLSPTDQPRIRDGVVGGAKWARRDQRRMLPGETGNTVHAGGLEGFGERHRRQDGAEPSRQH
jgi:hypothetical protein